ncbi:MAG: VOC family protein [Halomonas sp.]|uniref:VOC family protein n=1 Tax=Halomonas sp. TaxID=1486246 RepID=UPI003F916868
MKTGLVIYSSSIHRLAEFYCHVFGFEVFEKDESYALLIAGSFELVLLETEASKKALSTDKAREDTPIKPSFFIDAPLELIGEKIKEKGGAIYQPKSWNFGGRQVCDGCDCEGNIFQLRVGTNA